MPDEEKPITDVSVEMLLSRIEELERRDNERSKVLQEMIDMNKHLLTAKGIDNNVEDDEDKIRHERFKAYMEGR